MFNKKYNTWVSKCERIIKVHNSVIERKNAANALIIKICCKGEKRIIKYHIVKNIGFPRFLRIIYNMGFHTHARARTCTRTRTHTVHYVKTRFAICYYCRRSILINIIFTYDISWCKRNDHRKACLQLPRLNRARRVIKNIFEIWASQ